MGIKNVTANEAFFRALPRLPVMPGRATGRSNSPGGGAVAVLGMPENKGKGSLLCGLGRGALQAAGGAGRHPAHEGNHDAPLCAARSGRPGEATWMDSVPAGACSSSYWATATRLAAGRRTGEETKTAKSAKDASTRKDCIEWGVVGPRCTCPYTHLFRDFITESTWALQYLTSHRASALLPSAFIIEIEFICTGGYLE